MHVTKYTRGTLGHMLGHYNDSAQKTPAVRKNARGSITHVSPPDLIVVVVNLGLVMEFFLFCS